MPSPAEAADPIDPKANLLPDPAVLREYRDIPGPDGIQRLLDDITVRRDYRFQLEKAKQDYQLSCYSFMLGREPRSAELLSARWWWHFLKAGLLQNRFDLSETRRRWLDNPLYPFSKPL